MVVPVRALAALAATSLFLTGCTSRPMPTLDDYSYGTAAVVRRLAEALDRGVLPPDLFEGAVEGRSPDAAAVADLADLTDLAACWGAATDARRRSSLRIVDFRREGSRAARLAVEIRLEGYAPGASADTGERLVAQPTFELRLVRPDSTSPWRVREARRRERTLVFQHGRPHLREEAEARGLAFRHEPIDPVEARNIVLPATHHHPGVLLVDVNGDGALDIVALSRRPRLFLNDGIGHFRDATAGSGLDLLPEGEASGGVAADLDGDGLPELFLTGHFTPSVLLKNLGNGRFRDVTTDWGLAALAGPYTSAVFFDADGDGRVDLFVACYGDARKTGPAFSGRNGEPDRFFRNVDKGGAPFFVDETVSSGLGDVGWGFAAAACDFDDDGDDDLYVANDFGPHALYENRSTPGHPRFVNIAHKSGTEDDGYGMGVTWGDYDGDGRWDLYVSNYWTPYRWILRDGRWPMPPAPLALLARPIMARLAGGRSRGNSLFHSLGGGRFERTSDAAGVADGGWAWGTEFVDLDGNGREDLLVVNGMFQAAPGGANDEVAFWNWMGREGINFHDGIWGGFDFGRNGMASETPKKLFVNRGDGTFEERAFVEGFDTRQDARGLAYGDLDGDGAPEVVVSCFRGPLLLYENRFPPAPRIRVLLGRESGMNRDALGTVVRLWAGGKVQLREVRAGSSYLSQSSRELLFGLGKEAAAERIEVRWPGGRREELAGVPAGSRVVWMEGRAPVILTGEEARGLLPEALRPERPTLSPPSSR